MADLFAQFITRRNPQIDPGETVTSNKQTETTGAKALTQQLLQEIGQLMAFVTQRQSVFTAKGRKLLQEEEEERENQEVYLNNP